MDLRGEINKRLTLNLLIQGSAQHAFLTSHYLVRDELNRVDTRLFPLYDRLAVAAFRYPWCGQHVLVFGHSRRFWQRIGHPGHPFFGHPLLVRHGAMLAEASRKRAVERARLKGVSVRHGLFFLQLHYLACRVLWHELDREAQLVGLAKRVAHRVWGVPLDRLDGQITMDVAFGTLRRARTFAGMFMQFGASGYGGVLRQDSRLMVVARAIVWPILCHELVKGTAELICLHGLNTLDDAAYERVVDVTDHVDYEPWMMQVGPELWRRLLRVVPRGRPIAQVLMHIARLPSASLEALMMAVVDDPQWARELIEGLGSSRTA